MTKHVRQQITQNNEIQLLQMAEMQ